MAAKVFTIEVLTEEVTRRLHKLQAAGKDTTKVFETIGRTLVNRIRMGFRASSSPWGTPWLPLKRRKGQPLVDTGRLRRSIVAQPIPGGVEIGTNLKYARVHQFGGKSGPFNQVLAFTKAGKFQSKARSAKAKRVVKIAMATNPGANIPARPFMPLDPSGNLDMPPVWAQAVLRELGAHFKLATQK